MCHLDAGSRREKEKLGSREQAKEEDLNCMEAEDEKYIEPHDCDAPTLKESLQLDFSPLNGESELGTARPSQKETSSCFEEEKETPDCAALTLNESLDYSARKGKNEQRTGGQSQRERMSHFEEGKNPVQESSVLPPFSASNTHFTVTWQPTWQHYPVSSTSVSTYTLLRNYICSAYGKNTLLVADCTQRNCYRKRSTQQVAACTPGS